MTSNETLEFRVLTVSDLDTIAPLANKLHPHMQLATVRAYLHEMFQLPTYHCFGLWQHAANSESRSNPSKLIAMSNGWITIRIYSGKQLEVDNVIVDPDLRSKGVGKFFFRHIDQWAIQNGCQTIELNTFVQNAKSHKFYFNEGYKILGFHFQKQL